MMNEQIEETNYDDEDVTPAIPVPEQKKPIISSSTITTVTPIPSVMTIKTAVPTPVMDPGAIMLEPKPEKIKMGSVDRLLDGENLRNVIKALFNNADIISSEVKKGAKSSSNIYVHKRYTGKRVTVIVWND